MMLKFLSCIFLIMLLSGCSSTAAREWTTIKMSQSGGFIGLSRSIEISRDGKFVVSDDRAGQSTRGELSAQELSTLNDLIASTQSIPVMQPEKTGCADCFVYDLQIQDSGKNPGAQLNDVTLPESGLEPLVTFLRGLIDRTLK